MTRERAACLGAAIATALLLSACHAVDATNSAGEDVGPAPSERVTEIDAEQEDEPPTRGALFRRWFNPTHLATAVAGFGLGLAVGTMAVRRRRGNGRAASGDSRVADAANLTAAPTVGGSAQVNPRHSTVDHDAVAGGAPGEDVHPAVRAAIDAYDLAEGENQRLNVGRILERFDIHPLDPVGAAFDHRRHLALEARTCQDPQMDMTIAATIRPGWTHADGRLIRPAEVEVWRHQPTNVR